MNETQRAQLLRVLIADLRDHYNTDWDTTVPSKEFDAEIGRIVEKHLQAAYAAGAAAENEAIILLANLHRGEITAELVAKIRARQEQGRDKP